VGDDVTIGKKILSALAAAACLSLVSVAVAQEKAAPAPAAKTEKKPAKAKSACNGHADEAACKADTTCAWVAAQMDKATGKQKRKAYCRTKPKPPAKKKADAPKTDAAKKKEPAKN
jgi:hypothetical protein